jgi:4-amino-4-deoxy-L-arabinose transferase-like glycosyltransferase
MIAWWIRLGTVLAGDSPLGVRLLPILGAAATTWLTADLARRLGGSARTGLVAALAYNAMLTIGAGGILATPDAPAIFFWAATLSVLARVGAGGSPRLWVLAGLAAGLACISKYSALFLAPGVVLWLAASPEGRRRLLSPWPWTAVVAAGAVFATNLAWNATHDWLTFEKQFGRVEPSQFRPAYLGELLTTQFVLLNPILAVLAGLGVWAAIRNRGRVGGMDLSLPLLAALPFCLYLALHSLHDRVQAHWPATVFAAFALAVAGAVTDRPWGLRPRLLAGGLGLGLFAMVGVLAWAGLQGPPVNSRTDPLLPIRGWPDFARQVEAARVSAGADWVGVAHYGALSQLAATGQVKAPLIHLIERERWPDARPAPVDRPGLVLDKSRRLSLPDLQACFGKVTPMGELVRGVPTSRVDRYPLYRVEGPVPDLLARGCPDELGKNRRR